MLKIKVILQKCVVIVMILQTHNSQESPHKVKRIYLATVWGKLENNGVAEGNRVRLTVESILTSFPAKIFLVKNQEMNFFKLLPKKGLNEKMQLVSM